MSKIEVDRDSDNLTRSNSNHLSLVSFLEPLGIHYGPELTHESVNEFFRFRKDELMTNREVVAYLSPMGEASASDRHSLKKLKWRSNDKFCFAWFVMKYCQIRKIQSFALTCDHWREIAAILENDDIFLKRKWTAMVKHTTCLIKWSPAEQELLRKYMALPQYAFKWTELSLQIHKQSTTHILRGCKDVRERWFNYLDPTLVKDKWAPEEDAALVRLAGEFGKKWSLIARHMPGRTENQVKNRLNSMMKRNLITDEAFSKEEEPEEADDTHKTELDEKAVSPLHDEDENQVFLANVLREVENSDFRVDMF